MATTRTDSDAWFREGVQKEPAKAKPEPSLAPVMPGLDLGSLTLTEEEIRQGWNKPKLAAYIAERNRAAFTKIFGDPTAKARRPIRVQGVKNYNPHKW